VGILIVIGIAVVSYIVILKPQLSQTQHHIYALNEEIRGYPVEELSISIAYWKTTKQLHELGFWYDAKEGNVFVMFNFTIRNIANTEIDFYENNFFLKLMPIDRPLLVYNDYYAQAYTSWNYWAGDFLLSEPRQSLMPNQTTKGLLTYEILDGYEPIELVYPSRESPIFIVRIKAS
jgi:hypothetical protein